MLFRSAREVVEVLVTVSWVLEGGNDEVDAVELFVREEEDVSVVVPELVRSSEDESGVEDVDADIAVELEDESAVKTPVVTEVDKDVGSCVSDVALADIVSKVAELKLVNSGELLDEATSEDMVEADTVSEFVGDDGETIADDLVDCTAFVDGRDELVEVDN